jgi:hypothetical protein
MRTLRTKRTIIRTIRTSSANEANGGVEYTRSFALRGVRMASFEGKEIVRSRHDPTAAEEGGPVIRKRFCTEPTPPRVAPAPPHCVGTTFQTSGIIEDNPS